MSRQTPDQSLFHHTYPAQIRFNDIDILRHVNNTVYFSIYDTGKAHYFQAVREGKVNWQEVDTVIANVNCAYISPIFFGENIEVLTRCKSRHDKSFVLEQMLVARPSGEVKSVCETVMVSFDPKTMKSTPLADYWCEALDAFEGHNLYKPVEKKIEN